MVFFIFGYKQQMLWPDIVASHTCAATKNQRSFSTAFKALQGFEA